MKKRVLAAVLCLALVLAALPVAVSADVLAPTGSGTNFFANGTSITIAEQPLEGAKEAGEGFDNFTAKLSGEETPVAYISWNEGSDTKYIGVSDDVRVFGGSDGSSGAVSVPSTSITMSGGTVDSIYAGNMGEENNNASDNATTVSKVTGDAVVNITGGTINYIVCAGSGNAAIEGTFFLTIQNTNSSGIPSGNFGVMAGILGRGSVGLCKHRNDDNYEQCCRQSCCNRNY